MHWTERMGRLVVIILMLTASLTGHAQQADSIQAAIDTLAVMDSLTVMDDIDLKLTQEEPIASKKRKGSVVVDSTRVLRQKRDWATWKPDPQRALWLALVLPGAGQIYNRKYWKLPIIYGGFMGCIYALTWNNMMYKDYSQAYLDIMDDDPGTASYNKFLHLGSQITSANEERYKQIFKSRKDKYRRWRDMSFFVMIGVYALSVIDAYVDAELSEFDISKDLSLRVEPAVIPNYSGGNLLQAQSLGVNCCLNF